MLFGITAFATFSLVAGELARERQTIADVLSHPAIVLLDRPKQIVILGINACK